MVVYIIRINVMVNYALGYWSRTDSIIINLNSGASSTESGMRSHSVIRLENALNMLSFRDGTPTLFTEPTNSSSN